MALSPIHIITWSFNFLVSFGTCLYEAAEHFADGRALLIEVFEGPLIQVANIASNFQLCLELCERSFRNIEKSYRFPV